MQLFFNDFESMKPEIITAMISAIVAVISALISIYGQTRIAHFTDQLAKQREAASREAQTEALMSKYRDPLLRSTIDLQSRLFNICQRNFLQRFYHRSESEKDYAILNTLYVVGEYFGWVEILRKEVQFLDLGDIKKNRCLNELLVNVTKAFGTSDLNPIFRLFNGEQRAIGEIMLVPRSFNGSTGYECMGYAAFAKKMSDQVFARWFSSLEQDIEKLAGELDISKERLILIHDSLIDLVDFLDPDFTRISAKHRTRIKRR